MKNIQELIPDIYQTIKEKKGWSNVVADSFATEVSLRLRSQFGEAKEERKPTLRLSQMGPKCPRALWYSIHHPELAEPIPPWAEFKYAYGHLIEALAIALARASDHTVEGEQDELVVNGIVGHRDCVIDGCLVDVKSTSSRGFTKFKDGSLHQDDSFGYLDQLDGYLVGSVDDPLVKVKDRGYILAIDKQLGHMALYEHRIREESIRQRIAEYKEIIEKDEPPSCCCGTQTDGKAGNIKLDVKASYSPYKHCCFPHLRTFLYSSGPVYLTKVVRVPDVTEVDKTGEIVYR